MKLKIRTKAKLSNEVTELETRNAYTSYKAAVEGIVLLENDGVLPIDLGRVALYGAGAGMTIKGGTGSGEVFERRAISIYEGMVDAGFAVSTTDWIDAYRKCFDDGEAKFCQDFRDELKRNKKEALSNVMANQYLYPVGPDITDEDIEKSETDVCFYVIARQAGEGADKKLDTSEYQVTEEELANIKKCAASYKKFILVINTGSAFDLSFTEEIEGINAIIFYCQQGMMGGVAFADVVSGKACPSGRLTATWPRKYEDIPFAMEYSHLNGDVAEEYYKEDIFVGYRYFDTFKVKPRYAFGYGLSYTTFETKLTNIQSFGTKVVLKYEIRNTGSVSGKESVLTFIKCPDGETLKEEKKLVCFGKTEVIEPGEKKELTMSFDMKSVAYYDTKKHSYLLDKGDYILKTGDAEKNADVAAIYLPEDIKVSLNVNICEGVESLEGMLDREKLVERLSENVKNQEEEASSREKNASLEAGAILSSYEKMMDSFAGIESITIEKAAFIEEDTYKYVTHGIKHSEVVDEIMERLSIEDMAELLVGGGMKGRPGYFDAPGAAGYTTSKLLDKGIPNVCLVDGPAGLRLQRISVPVGGKLKGTEPIISFLKYFPEPIKKVMFADASKGTPLYQYVTSFPVGTSLAQTFNESLIEEVGSAVGAEMEEYGITYWLAPGMNIHRNPLCGRNFEYYSEDPVVTGKIAAAMTRGVESHRGCHVTIKHFCCNNQEDNRNFTNANVTERALREIYLKGFEIAVKEGRPGALMTSYNKVNGKYANNSYDLLTKVLRNEWGFDGLVMTDWLATGGGKGDHALAIAAGNDLIAPGSKGDAKYLIESLKTDKLCREDIRRCASNVLYGITTSRIYNGYLKDMKKKNI